LMGSALFGQSSRQGMSHPDHMEHRLDNPQQLAKSFDDPARDAWQMPDRVIAALGLKQGGIVADIGAGTGYFTVRLAKSDAKPKVYAVDIEPSMVNYLKDRAAKEGLNNVVAVQAAAETPNLPEPVDVVLLVDTFHHIGGREVYFRNLAKSLKPGGKVAIIDFRPGVPDGPPKEFHFTPEQVKSEMSKAGYKLTAQPDFLPRQQFLIFASR
ncbi:MAG: class I SAM-dependent methyltransferase, partial [Bryobacteraceae bacterium]